MPAILAALLGGLGRFLADKLSYYVAMKALMIALIVVVLPVVLKNVIIWLVETMHNAVVASVAGYSLESQIIQVSGLSAYLCQQLQLPLCISMIVTALTIRLVLNFIPWVG